MTGYFVPGNNANPEGSLRRKHKLAALRADLSAEFGGLGALTGADRALIAQCAELLLRKPEDDVSAVRIANTVDRILGRMRRRYGHDRGKGGPTFEQALAVHKASRDV